MIAMKPLDGSEVEIVNSTRLPDRRAVVSFSKQERINV
jgi:hypothetical protein